MLSLSKALYPRTEAGTQDPVLLLQVLTESKGKPTCIQSANSRPQDAEYTGKACKLEVIGPQGACVSKSQTQDGCLLAIFLLDS